MKLPHIPLYLRVNLSGRGMVMALLFAMVATLSGCATTANNPKDPLEPFNRAMFTFNDVVDKTALKPAATVYQKVLPSFAQAAIGNFFGNLADVWTTVNDVLQGKLVNGLNDMMRVAVNSTFGMAGLLDIGSEAGLPKHKEDFGQTLGKWGVKSGPYVVLPLFGPSTMRDSLALPVDLVGDPWSYAKPSSVFIAGSVVRVVDQRAAVLEAGDLIEEAALDRYEFLRDAYLQRRESKIFDGDPPSSSAKEPEKKADVDAKPDAVIADATGVAGTKEAVALAKVDIKSEAKADLKSDADPKAAPKPEQKPAQDVPMAQDQATAVSSDAAAK